MRGLVGMWLCKALVDLWNMSCICEVMCLQETEIGFLIYEMGIDSRDTKWVGYIYWDYGFIKRLRWVFEKWEWVLGDECVSCIYLWVYWDIKIGFLRYEMESRDMNLVCRESRDDGFLGRYIEVFVEKCISRYMS